MARVDMKWGGVYGSGSKTETRRERRERRAVAGDNEEEDSVSHPAQHQVPRYTLLFSKDRGQKNSSELS